MIRSVSEGFSGYQLCFRENQSWNSTDSELIFLLQNFGFSALFQSWISAVQRFWGNEQRWNRPESILNQSWSALNVSETSTRVNSFSFILKQDLRFLETRFTDSPVKIKSMYIRLLWKNLRFPHAMRYVFVRASSEKKRPILDVLFFFINFFYRFCDICQKFFILMWYHRAYGI